MKIDLAKIGERICRVRGDRSGVEFGKLIGVSNKSISCYESGAVWPKPHTLSKIIELSGKSADWLLFGAEAGGAGLVADSHEEYTVSMPVRAMAGAGNPWCIDQMEPIGHITIDKMYNGPTIQVVKIRGSSMEPTIMDGGYVGVDTGSKEIVSGQMYAVYIPHEGIVVKRLWIGPELVKIASDNPAAPDHEMMIERVDWNTFVQGRVKWVLQEYYNE